MKKILGLITTLFLVFGGSSLVSASGTGNLHFSPVNIYYEGSDVVIQSVLSNTGNRSIENVSSFSLDVFDANGNKIVSTVLNNDSWLSKLRLNPGESSYWQLQVSGAQKGDLSSYNTKYNANFKSVGNPSHNNGILIVVNNDILHSNVAPFIENGTTLVPLRAIFESLGAEVNWDGKTNTVTAQRGDTIVKLTLGQKYLTVNGNKVTLGTAAKSIKGSTMVPLRAISQSFGGTVSYGTTGKATTISIRIN